jgi:predicted nuclease of predicted toxin-antitoxin system
MKILLDENLDHRLRNQLDDHEVFTASYKGGRDSRTANSSGQPRRTASAFS